MPPKFPGKGTPSGTSLAASQPSALSLADGAAAEEGAEGGPPPAGKGKLFGKGKGKFFGKGKGKGKFLGKGKKFFLKKGAVEQDDVIITESGTEINPIDLTESQQEVVSQYMQPGPPPPPRKSIRKTIKYGESRKSVSMAKRRMSALHEKHQPEEFHYVGFYRHVEKQLPLAIKAHSKCFPWPPRGLIFFSSGYYQDWASKKGIEFIGNTLRLHNVPTDVTEEEIGAGFIGNPNIQMGKTTTVKFDDVEQARDAYVNTKHIKIASGDLLFLRGGDFYITNIPKNTTEKHLRALYPNAVDVKVVHNGPGGESYAYVRFATDEEKNDAFTNGPLPLNEDETSIDGTDIVRRGNAVLKNPQPKPNEVWIDGVPSKNIKEEDFLRFFPGATSVKFMTRSGFSNMISGTKKYAVVTFDNPEEAQKASAKAPKKYYKSVGPRHFQLTRRLPKASDLTDEDIDGMTDAELARNLWKVPEAEFSNISNLFSPTITLSGLNKDVTRTEILKSFPEAKRVDLTREGKTMTATVEFGDPLAAAQAFSKARSVDIGGAKPTVGAVTPKSGRRKSRKSLRKSIARKKSRVSIRESVAT